MGHISNLTHPAMTADQRDAVARHMLAIPTLIAAADDGIADVELQDIANLCAHNATLRALSAAEIKATVTQIIAQIKAEGVDAVIDAACAALTSGQRETAMCFGVRVAMADGGLDDAEEMLLIDLSARFDIAKERLLPMFDVISILQRPAA